MLVVSFGPRLHVDGRTYTSFAAGLHDAPAITEHDGYGYGIQSYMTPLGARCFFGLPMGEITGQVVELEDLIGGPAARELAERLATAPDWPARCRSGRRPSTWPPNRARRERFPGRRWR